METQAASRRLATAPVQRFLRWAQVALYAASAIFSLVSCATLKVAYDDMGGKCPLYAKPSKAQLLAPANGSHQLHIGQFVGGSSKTCFYCMYLGLAAAAYSLAWGLLFAVLSAPKKARHGHLRRLVFPSLLFNSVLFTSEIIASCVLTLGYRFWCRQVLQQLHSQEGKSFSLELSCPVVQSLPWRVGDSEMSITQGRRMFGLLTVSQASSWMVSLTLLVLSAVCCERFFKAVWFGELEGSSDSVSTSWQTKQRRPPNGLLPRPPPPAASSARAAPPSPASAGAVFNPGASINSTTQLLGRSFSRQKSTQSACGSSFTAHTATCDSGTSSSCQETPLWELRQSSVQSQTTGCSDCDRQPNRRLQANDRKNMNMF